MRSRHLDAVWLAASALGGLGGVLLALQSGITHYWMNAYWGGALAAIGGRLVLGSLSCLRNGIRFSYALLLALGIAILANSRPYEGLVLRIAVFAASTVWLLRHRISSGRDLLLKGLLPIALVFLPVFAAMGAQFKAVTGKPFVIPQELYRKNMR